MSLREKLLDRYEKVFPGYRQELAKALLGFGSILDVGCGSGSPTAALVHLAGAMALDLASLYRRFKAKMSRRTRT